MGSSASSSSSCSTSLFVLSFTTVPWRLNDELALRVTTLLSALPEQFSAQLNLPYALKRDGSLYPAVPTALLTHPRVHICRVEDQGPITKVLPTLKQLLGKRVVVVVMDDDIVYSGAYIRALTRKSTPDAPFVSGITSKRYYTAGKVPEGFSGYAIPMPLVSSAMIDFIEHSECTQPASACFNCDDYVMGAAFARFNIPIHGFSTRGIPRIDSTLSLLDPNALWRLSSSLHERRYDACKAHIDARA